MAQAHFERLSAGDLSFLAMEDGRAHMHIGAVSIYEAGPLRRPDGRIDLDRVLALAEARLPRVPRLRQRLARVPGLAQPGWIDDDRFELSEHIRCASLPPPGDDTQLKALAGRLLSVDLDRTRPLWDFCFVDGLTGDRVALVAKVHHCLADGVAGVAVGNLLVGPDPDYHPPPATAWVPRPAPSGARLVVDELGHRLAAPIRLVRAQRAAGDGGATRHGASSMLADAVRRRPTSPLRTELGPERRFDWTSLPFTEVRSLGKQAGGTVNDVALALLSGALGAFLAARGEHVADLDVRAVVPVSLRRSGEHRATGNRVSELIAHLPLADADPWHRLLAVVEHTTALKASGQAGTGDLVNQVIDLLPAQLIGPLFRLFTTASPADLIVTNVPGPPMPVYLLGARQLASYPVVPLLAGQALGVALLSYDGRLFWGFNADREGIADLHDLVEGTEAAFDELRSTAPPSPDR